MRTWSNPDPVYDRTWYAWFMFRSSNTVDEAAYWLEQFFERRAYARARRRFAKAGESFSERHVHLITRL